MINCVMQWILKGCGAGTVSRGAEAVSRGAEAVSLGAEAVSRGAGAVSRGERVGVRERCRESWRD